ncbi:MAG: hypothetical protein NC117_07295 [Pseudoflavonifractor sp.]|nr:hypothetical protein [Pseudoflavonifractor sp.]
MVLLVTGEPGIRVMRKIFEIVRLEQICNRYGAMKIFIMISLLLGARLSVQATEVEETKLSSNAVLGGKVSILLMQLSDDERVKPTFDVELERKVSDVIIGDDSLSGNYIVTLKAGENKGVRVKVRNTATGLTAYRKNFSKSFLYGLSDNALLVGKGDILTQVIVWKENGKWVVMIKEKGIY